MAISLGKSALLRPNLPHRLIDFQTKYDLLDNEIRWLKRAGHLRVTRQELIVDTSWLMPMYGWFQVTLVSLVCAAAILQLAGLEPPHSVEA